jgi:hypothetical protein
MTDATQSQKPYPFSNAIPVDDADQAPPVWFGVFGEYPGRICGQSQDRPHAVIREKVQAKAGMPAASPPN